MAKDLFEVNPKISEERTRSEFFVDCEEGFSYRATAFTNFSQMFLENVIDIMPFIISI